MKLKTVLIIAFVTAAVAGGAAFYLGVRSAGAPAAGDTAAVSGASVPDVPGASDDSPVSELEAETKGIDGGNVLYAIGVGESADEMAARSMAADDARAKLAAAADARTRNANTADTNGEMKTGGIMTNNTFVHKTVTQQNKNSGEYRVYSLIIRKNEEAKTAD